MAEIMVRIDDLRRYCENRHCGSVPIEYIKQMPTIEAEPVRTGRWIRTSEPCAHTPVQHCSECGCNVNFDFLYCPDCGAKMAK